MEESHKPTEDEWKDLGRGPDKPRYRLIGSDGKTIGESDWVGTLIKLQRKVERNEGYKPKIIPIGKKEESL